MPNISRRGFLKGLFATAAVVAVPAIIAPEIDLDYERWVRGEGRIWAPKWRAPVDPRLQIIRRGSLSTSEGRKLLAESMIQPLRNRRDYSSLGRQVFSIDPIGEGPYNFLSTQEAQAAKKAW